MTNTNHSAGQQNRLYPRHVSTRADELLDQLDLEQIQRLYNELQTMTCSVWTDWLQGEWERICIYDKLTHAERNALLRSTVENWPLLLHHACVYVELWRARIHRQYMPLPPYDDPIETLEAQRKMMLAALVSYDHPDLRDYWPFDHPEIDTWFPFRPEP